jgi:hypothetical protein
MKKYKLVIVPSLEEEHLFEEAVKFSDVVKVVSKTQFATIHEFNTKQERDSFIDGYKSAIGFLGNGLYYIN